MKLSPWRLVHLWLALVSSIFLIIASVTGAILSFEPVYENSHSYQIEGADALMLSEVMATVRQQHEEVLTIERDENGFVSLTSFEYDQPVYINPFTAEVIGEPFPTPEIFEFSRALHRSLFLKSTGRFIIGITSLFLVLMCISGLWLVLQKQGGWSKAFTKIVKNDFYQDWHTKLGRLSLLVLLIVSLTGTYLFLNRFSIVPELQLSHQPNEALMVEAPKLSLNEFPSLEKVTLSELRLLNFPFAEDAAEFYEVKLDNRELLINQFTGEAISQVDYPLVNLMHDWSFALHTGEGTVIWALVLGLSSLAILFFLYSGVTIFLKRGKVKTENPFPANDCEYIVLVGSEQGSTYRYAAAVHKALLASGARSFITELNAYEPFERMKKLLVLTATYGLGEATSNAKSFLSKLGASPPAQRVDYAVLGFGSTDYPDFCQYAIEVDNKLEELPNFSPILHLEKVNKGNLETFNSWVKALSKMTKIALTIDQSLLSGEKPEETRLAVTHFESSPNQADATFFLELKARKKVLNGYRSGDLMAVVPAGSDKERLYSMSVDRQHQTIGLSVRRHEHGLCSTFLSALSTGDSLKASFKVNQGFHFPKEAPGVIMIANGTGIAPFLGMIAENTHRKPIRLYWGGQNQASYGLYRQKVEQLISGDLLQSLYLAFSREGEKQYVQDLLNEHMAEVIQLLNEGHVIMICGGLAMQQGVETVIEAGLYKWSTQTLAFYKEQQQIKADCY